MHHHFTHILQEDFGTSVWPPGLAEVLLPFLVRSIEGVLCASWYLITFGSLTEMTHS